jgi:hypothetical protein
MVILSSMGWIFGIAIKKSRILKKSKLPPTNSFPEFEMPKKTVSNSARNLVRPKAFGNSFSYSKIANVRFGWRNAKIATILKWLCKNAELAFDGATLQSNDDKNNSSNLVFFGKFNNEIYILSHEFESLIVRLDIAFFKLPNVR